MIAKKGQSCALCEYCDGFACLKYDVWLDGKMRVDGGQKRLKNKEKNYIPVLVYGKRYCPKFRARKD